MSDSTWRLLIPTAASNGRGHVHLSPAPNDPDGRSGNGSRRALRVLIVDGDPETADGLSRTIGDWGHEVRWICEGAAALPLAIAHQAEVVLLDIGLSEMSAYDLAHALRSEPRLKGCFLLALRWRSDRRRDKQFREADIDMFLAKPVDLLVLETLLTLEGDRLAS
jgi:DNA-binding response OmpR family regulator